MYKAYFGGVGAYASERVNNALASPPTGICSTICTSSGQSSDDCLQCRREIAKKTSNYMGVWMHVIGNMDTAITECNAAGAPDGSQSWDNALAYYSGSLE